MKSASVADVLEKLTEIRSMPSKIKVDNSPDAWHLSPTTPNPENTKGPQKRSLKTNTRYMVGGGEGTHILST